MNRMKCVYWINLAQNTDKWRTAVTVVMHL